MQQGLIRFSRWLEALCKLIAGIALAGMLAVTVIDVTLRYLYRLSDGALDLSMVGSVELVSYLMLFALLAAMAANVEKGQVVVEAFSHRLNDEIKTRLNGFYLLGFTALGLVVAIGLWDSALSAGAHGEVTQDLRLPMGPIYWTAAGLSLLLSVRSLAFALLGLLFNYRVASVEEV
ncbi:TRAP transporter small permease [Modicisalibacter xianhensis]|uniref:TRAP transporter small permease protein n=1 Tax=Modicisalibacter xianhensis TaxID=442341 RepID=A0A1I3G442_9GAMM|nr:TRAP transporter small permease subunit [Halomonas xianhensis]SFI18259.1 TRAP-type C4-dicarboxylate transport system, small permease component [Halomonas xianhensis]